ncbi:ig family protein [Stylonychia lemnae]|uniref:Ig family protein n=1 Tax=Stylonychia lemnae TaxID=5949 RepID=A0A078AYC2_STYLE|nr:ig family protein [Stylonychia lemnae]|eukprot:CDW87400.1 ig family protein [Stylonychia lemnae]
MAVYSTTDQIYMRNLAVDASNNIYTLGTKSDGIIYSKFDQTGTKVWSMKIGSGTVTAQGIALETFGWDTIYATGSASSSTLNQNLNNDDIFLLSADTTTGNSNWIRYWGGTLGDYGAKPAVSPDGSKILVSGQQDSFLLPTMSTGSILLLFDFKGNFYWSKTYTSTTYNGFNSKDMIFSKQGDYFYESINVKLSNNKINTLLRKSILSTTVASSFSQLIGSSTGDIVTTQGLALTPDESFIIYPTANSNADYRKTANSEVLLLCYYTSNGNVNWISQLYYTGKALSVLNGDISPDGTKYYTMVYVNGQGQGIFTSKVFDGTQIRFRKWMGNYKSYSFKVNSLDRLIISTDADSGAFKIGSNNNMIITSWDYAMDDLTCSSFSFATDNNALSSLFTDVTLSTPTFVDLKIQDIYRKAVDTTGANTAASLTLIVQNLLNLCTGNTLIFPSSVSTQTLTIGDTLTLSQTAFCYQGTGSGSATSVYTSTQPDGQTLPSWLTFNPLTRTWSGSPSTSGVIYVSMRADYTISSVNHAVVSLFKIVVKNTPPYMQYSIPSVSKKTGTFFKYQIDTNTFGDAEGDSYQIYAFNSAAPEEPLPGWLFFNRFNNTFSGISPKTQSLDVIVYAIDSADQVVSTTFTLTITNNAPRIITYIPEMVINTMEQFNYKIPSNYFADADGDKLKITSDISSTDCLKQWLSFNQASSSFSGIPPQQCKGSYTITLTISDGFTGGSITDSFSLTVNAKPTQHQTNGFIPEEYVFGLGQNTIDLSQYFEDLDSGSVLTYSITKANGQSTGTWITINANTGLLTINAVATNAGAIQLLATVADSRGSAFQQGFRIIINSVPKINESMETLQATVGITFAKILSPTLFKDPENQKLKITCTQNGGLALPSWLKFDILSNQLYGTPASTDIGSSILELKATDNYGLVTSLLYVNLEIKSNNPPIIRFGQSMAAQTVKSNLDFSFEIPDKLFQDPDGESAVLNLLLADGSDLPSWIKFTPLNRLVYGTATTNLTSLNLKILASDQKRATASATFSLNIVKNKAPLVLNEIGKIQVYMNIYFQYQIPESIFRDEDADELSYYMAQYDVKNQIPPWLKFIPGNRTLNGMAKDGEGQTLMFKIFADDGRGGVSYQVLYLEINANYDLGKLIPLIVLGWLPIVGIFGFAFAMAFVKVPSLGNDHILQGNSKVDYDTLRMALEEQVRYKKRQQQLTQNEEIIYEQI